MTVPKFPDTLRMPCCHPSPPSNLGCKPGDGLSEEVKPLVAQWARIPVSTLTSTLSRPPGEQDTTRNSYILSCGSQIGPQLALLKSLILAQINKTTQLTLES